MIKEDKGREGGTERIKQNSEVWSKRRLSCCLLLFSSVCSFGEILVRDAPGVSERVSE